MLAGDDLGDGHLVERDPVKVCVVVPCKGLFMIGTLSTHIAKGGRSRKHEHEPQQMGDKLALRSVGLLETTQYTLEQSHGVPPFSVALDTQP